MTSIRSSLTAAILLQIGLTLFAALSLDGGRLLKIYGGLSIIVWFMLVFALRRGQPSTTKIRITVALAPVASFLASVALCNLE